MEANISQLSNSDLFEKLKFYGIAKGPVTNTTRNLYEKKLIQHLKENRIPTGAAVAAATGGAGDSIIIPAAVSPAKPSPKPAPVQQPSPPKVVYQYQAPEVVDITPSKNTIRIQTDYDPIVHNNHNESVTSSTVYSSSSYSTNRVIQPPQQQPQAASNKFEFKLLKDPIAPRQTTNSSINISPMKMTAPDDDILSNIRIRPAARTSYVSDQIDEARQHQQSSSRSSAAATSSEIQSGKTDSGSNWRLYAVIVAIIIIVYVFYTFFLTESAGPGLDELSE